MAESLRLDITPERYELRNGRALPFLGPNWLAGVHAKWDEMLSLSPGHLSIDISQLEFVTLMDWLHLVSWVERLIDAGGPSQIDLDLLGPSPLRLMDYISFLEVEHGRPPKIPYTVAELEYSQKKYTLVGFLESLDTYGVLNRPGRGTRVIYPGLSRQAALLKSFFSSRPTDKPKVVLGLQRVATKEDCRLFLNDSHILNWRHSMDERFRSSPLFESDEIWRVLCHELATNIYEHAGVAGFISARVVGEVTDPKTRRLRSWCRWTYPRTLHPLLKRMKTGFLEICVSDAGRGFVDSLRRSVAKRSGLAQHSISTLDVLAFAFDELGTCKESQDSWATARHGLCRVLNLVAKYGGGLLLRSSDAEVTYVAEMDRFRRRRNGLGYEPQHVRSLPYPIRGSQLQLILPLIPLFDRPRLAPGRRLLEIGLPESFRTQPDHFRGHLVPLLELLETSEVCIGREELRVFRNRCERLSLDLLGKRPRHEPLVLDFSGLRWTPAQFETFLYLMQNVLQGRPVLMVELEDQLVIEVLESERGGRPTSINSDLLFDDTAEGRSFGELSERLFLETYSGIHATVLGVTRNGEKHIFGLPSEDYEMSLLQLMDAPARIEEICSATPSIEESLIRSILTPANPLFEADADLWSLTWTKEMILVETERAVLAHFDSVAVRSKAWRGRRDCGDKGRERFYIPWSNVWRREFLQASRILNRGRQVDEIAQRLIFRLKMGLAQIGKGLSSVRVLVCVSAPAMLLATALHRWWPEASPPAVADLGHYIFLGDWEGLPAITSEGGLVLVQDVLDDGKVTQFVLESLRKQAREALFVLSFIRFSGEDDSTLLQSNGAAIPADALIEIARPEDCEAPHEGDDDSYDYWVEPRSLRPVKLTTLRREFLRGRDPDLERRNLYLERFDSSSMGCLIMSGHFVYGLRHFAATVDIKRTLESGIGDEIAYWVADICEGGVREKMLWESEVGSHLKGDVTAVLMPLHSQIHYLWPKVERLLAQRGRRQPMWLLEPALFTGNGPGYRLPLQFRRQIQAAVNDLGEGGLEGRGRIRILVLDDAIASGRTATTILATIMGEMKKFARRESLPENPIEWIRYFAILNQADHANHLLWRNITDIGVPSIQIVREEYAPFMGVTVYDDSDCPLCRDRRRLKQLMKDCEDFGGQGARGWVAERIRELAPVAVDGAHFKEPSRPKLKRPLDVLAHRRKREGAGRYQAIHVDTAIWRLYELMYLSYPPSEVLVSLKEAWPDSQETDLVEEYERYRWGVYEWCIRHWRRVVSDSASEAFCSKASQEIEDSTDLIERLLEALSTRYEDPHISIFIMSAIDRLASLEEGRNKAGSAADRGRIERVVRLDTALQLFFFNAERFDRERRGQQGPSEEYRQLLAHLDTAARPLDKRGHSLLRNLHRRLMRPGRFAEPSWALKVVAESLFRGRTREEPDGSHKLLPKLLSRVLQGMPDSEEIRLLHGSLVLFMAALDDIQPYAEMQFSLSAGGVRDFGAQGLNWLRAHELDKRNQDRAGLRHLYRALYLEGDFCRGFEDVFHCEIRKVVDLVNHELRTRRASIARLVLSFIVSPEMSDHRVLTHIQRLVLTISNRAIDPIDRASEPKQSKIEIYGGDKDGRPGFACFKIMTEFADADETSRLMAESRNAAVEEEMLGAFGVIFEKWERPESGSIASVFSAVSRVYVPLGFKVKRVLS